ncbi:protein-S-isoprenylcysteine O-methyltransferase [Thermoflexales bacterium]|nr:protein-S-isoprenylcysteine O-methyltransferase [Thermoflexales bacterium]
MNNTFKIVFLVGLIIAEVIRFPHRQRNKREMREKKLAESRLNPLDVMLDFLAFGGMEVIPLIYIFTPWLDFANYALPPVLGWLGAVIFVATLWLLWRAHADLGLNWSPTLQITQAHQLVTQGVYHYIRHPIYAAMWLWGIAQVLLLQNWIAGPATLLFYGIVYFRRTPREEQMMLDRFGDEYRAYMQQTGRVIPKLGK